MLTQLTFVTTVRNKIVDALTPSGVLFGKQNNVDPFLHPPTKPCIVSLDCELVCYFLLVV